MTFSSLKSLLKVIDGDKLAIDGEAETARLFVPVNGRRIEMPERARQGLRRPGFITPKRFS